MVAQLKQDIRDEVNPLRERLDMPILKAMPFEKPRVRVYGWLAAMAAMRLASGKTRSPKSTPRSPKPPASSRRSGSRWATVADELPVLLRPMLGELAEMRARALARLEALSADAPLALH